jgi:ferritin-like metal-binding protein YciE
MLHSNQLSLRSLTQATPSPASENRFRSQRTQTQVQSQKIEALVGSLPENLSANKRAVIDRLVALYEQGALS